MLHSTLTQPLFLHPCPVSTLNSQALLEAQSGSSSSTSVATCLRDDDIDDIVFLEIDRELASLLSGLNARAQDATAADSERPENSQRSAHSEGDAAMIPCNTQNGASPDAAGRASVMEVGEEEENGILDLTFLDSSGDLLLSPTYLLDSWTEALLKDTASLSSPPDKLGGVPSAAVNGDIGNAAADGQEKPSSPVSAAGPAQASAFTSAPGSGAAVPAVSPMEQHDTQRTSGIEEVPHSGKDARGTPLDDGSLEESSKILAEIPGILTAFLDGGQLREKPSKKLRFNENRPAADGSGPTEQEQGSEELTGGEVGSANGSASSLKVESSVDRLSPLERLCPLPLEDEVFRALPEEPSSDR